MLAKYQKKNYYTVYLNTILKNILVQKPVSYHSALHLIYHIPADVKYSVKLWLLHLEKGLVKLIMIQKIVKRNRNSSMLGITLWANTFHLGIETSPGRYCSDL